MKSDIQLYPDLIKALEKNEIVYLFGAGFSTALSGRKYTWWDWIVDGIGRIKDHATADMLNESLMSDNSTDNMVSVVGKVIKILKEEGSYKTWMHEAFESTVVVNEKLKNTLMKILLMQDVFATTNYDHLLENATGLMAVSYEEPNVAFQMLKQGKSNNVLHIHGIYDSEKEIDNIVADVGRLITPLKIDISTGDVITPRAIEFNYDLLLEDCSISLWSYNLETILAEKLQTVLARGILNTRMRDFYDIRMLLDTYKDKVNKAVLKDAFAATCKKRGTDHLQEQAEEIIKIIEANEQLQVLWRAYEKKYSYAADRFHFTPEDFYVFVIAHAYKHYSRSGTGIRTLADIYIMNQKLGGTLNWEYVDSELRGLGIFSYEHESRELAQKIFGIAELPTKANLSEAEQQMLAYYLGASTYGTIENRILNQMQKLQPDDGAFTARTKRKYLLSRIFPGREWCKAYAPTVYKYPVLLPFFWVWRLIYKGITNRKKVTQEIKTIKAGKQN